MVRLSHTYVCIYLRSLFWFDIFAAINTAENTVRPEKSNLVSGNRPGGSVFYHLPAHIVECVSEYTFLIPKNKQRQELKKAKETKEEKIISIKKINLLPHGWRISSSSGFLERVFFVWPNFT